jgi:hypothetical protein
MEEERTPLQRAIISLGLGGVPGYAINKLLTRGLASEKVRERWARGAGAGGALTVGGAELGGYLGDDSYKSRALGGAIGGALGGIAGAGTDPMQGAIFKYLIKNKGLSPLKAAGNVLGKRAAMMGAAGALNGILSRPKRES